MYSPSPRHWEWNCKMTRLNDLFARLKSENRPALVTFVTAGDPDPETGYEIFSRLADSGALPVAAAALRCKASVISS